MPSSITIGRVAGSEIRIHVTFLFLVAWIGGAAYLHSGAGAALNAVLFLLAVFACVALHELGHALAARRYGITTPDITLLPIGGIARLARLPERPSEEIVIALAGPAVNVAIAAVLILVFGARVDLAGILSFGGDAHGFTARLAAVNVILVLFNLIPAFPMDGGRVLRAVLAYRLGRRQATVIAARIGQVLAAGFAAAGLVYGDPILVLIAVFVFLAAQAEAKGAGISAASRKTSVDQAMIRSFVALGPQTTVAQADDPLRKTSQQEFPVIDEARRPLGFVTRTALTDSHRTTGPKTPVVSLMTTGASTVASGQALGAAIDLMRQGATPFVAVVDAEGRLVGYLTPERISELIRPGRTGPAQGATAKA